MMPRKAGADLFWQLIAIAAVIMACGISIALVLFAIAPKGFI